MDSHEEKWTESQIAYRLANVGVKKFAERKIDLPEDQIEGFGYRLGVGADLDVEGPTISIGTLVSVTLDSDADADEPLIELEAVYTFAIRDRNSIVDEDGIPSIPLIVLASFVGISISTSRGILIGKSSYAGLGEAPLPPVSPMSLVRDFVQEQKIDWVSLESHAR